MDLYEALLLTMDQDSATISFLDKFRDRLDRVAAAKPHNLNLFVHSISSIRFLTRTRTTQKRSSSINNPVNPCAKTFFISLCGPR